MTHRDHNDEIEKNSEVDESRDPAWKLLLRARKPEVSPFFARNVLREIRQLEETETSGVWTAFKSLFTLPKVALAGAATVLVAIVLVNISGDSGSGIVEVAPAPAPTLQVVTVDPVTPPDEAGSANFDIADYQEEVQMIDVLDGLLAVQDVEVLDDDALAELLF